MMEKEKRDGFTFTVTVLPLLGAAAVLAFLLPRSAGAADDTKWHAHAHPVAGAVNHGAPAPAPTAGADDLPPPPSQQTAPHFGFPLQPGTTSAAAAAPAGEGYPFIGSNPTVPLPTGMTDTSTVLPMPDTGDDAAAAATKVVGSAPSVRARASIIGLGVFLATTMFLYNI